MMSFFEFAPLFLDEDKCTDFLLQSDALYRQRTCVACRFEMALMGTRDSWRCENRACRKQVSIRSNSFFSKSKLPCSKILAMAYLWVHRSKTTDICTMIELSPNTVCAYQAYFRQLVCGHLMADDGIIGGEETIVEIDESKLGSASHPLILGKRKYNRGHPVEGVWVVGGIERTVGKRMFIVPVADRKAETLIAVIKEHVLPGTTIYTDLWKGYSSLDLEGFHHGTVNHSKCFVDPNTGVHTNSIEGAWSALKMHFAPRQRTKDDIENRLGEYLWRRQNKNTLWQSFLNALSQTHYD